MGGDLNMKKSWHPLTRANQERVWKAEQAAEAERRKVEQLRRELQEERAVEELRRLQEAAGHKKKSERLDWMYQDGGAGRGAPGDDAGVREAVLLGRQRVDVLIDQLPGPSAGDAARPSTLMEGVRAGGATAYGIQANSARDTMSKVREDPLFDIRRRELAMAPGSSAASERVCREAPRESLRESRGSGSSRRRDRSRDLEGSSRPGGRSRDHQNSSRRRERSRDRLESSRRRERSSDRHDGSSQPRSRDRGEPERQKDRSRDNDRRERHPYRGRDREYRDRPDDRNYLDDRIVRRNREQRSP